ncbi:MAG TPA: BMP family ABC transporter substrate-binding protein [Acidimicrobiia bacterium]|nr:BMP family ABC transporter substrate-binding protein [Acidimicrobiia bacterium]
MRQHLRVLSLLAIAMLVLAACGGTAATTTTAPTTDTTAAPTETTDAPTETTAGGATTTGAAPAACDATVGLVFDIGGRGDQSFNDSAAAGLERAAEELGITFTEASPNDDGSNRAELLQLAADASDIVIAVGFLFEGDAAATAAENPDTNFAVVDTPMLDFTENPEGVPYGDNTAGLVFSEEQGSFLVGAAAALKSTTGTVGFIGGVSGVGGLIEKFEAGYMAGAMAVNPDIEILSEYITAAPDFDGFNAPDQAREIALAMYDGGADIIYHAAGGSGAGLFEAASVASDTSGSKVWAIGVDSDQYNTADPGVQEFILTSMLKRVDVAVFEAIRSQCEGTFASGPTAYDLSVDGVGYATSGGFVDDIADQLEDFKAQIVSGDIVVPTDPAEVGA